MRMRNNFRTAIALGAAICGFAAQLACQAQDAASTSTKNPAARITTAGPPAPTDLFELAAIVEPGTGPGTPVSEAANPAAGAASGAAGASPASSSTAAEPASVTAPLNNDAVIKELTEMKARIAQLEAELKANRGVNDAASAEKDANALRSAETGESGSLEAVGQAAPAPPPAAALAAPEIDAQVTKKGEPFPGDWTWLNSNGHQIDSPMSTKYFTPEFRADANYSLDYNHPHDDSLGGSTETFRADEWQLEQISLGGDIRINNVRGRILTMNGLFATTTVRNDASPSRGQWDLAGAYKYVSEA